MNNRQDPAPITILGADAISSVLDYLDPASLNRLNIIGQKSNPFLKSATNEVTEQSRWKQLTALHFSHFLNRRINQGEITDWKEYFIECYENSYVVLPGKVDIYRMVRLSILMRDGNIAGLEKENLQLKDLELYLTTENKRLYELASSHQQLCDYLYKNIILPKLHIANASFWACVLHQPVNELKKRLDARFSRERTSDLGLRLITAALRVGSNIAIDYLYPQEPGCPSGVEWLKLVVTNAPVHLVEIIYEKDKNIWIGKELLVLSESLKNPNLNVFVYLFTNFKSALANSDLISLFQQSLQCNGINGSILAFKALYDSCDNNREIKKELMPILKDYLTNNTATYPANDAILEYILINTPSFFDNKSDFFRAKQRLITKHHTHAAGYLLKLMYEKRENRSVSQEELFYILCGEMHIENIYLANIMLGEYRDKLPAVKKHELFYKCLLAELKLPISVRVNFGAIKQVYNNLKACEGFDVSKLSDHLCLIMGGLYPGHDTLLARWYVWDFLLSQQLMPAHFNFHVLFSQLWHKNGKNHVLAHIIATQLDTQDKLSLPIVRALSSFPAINMNGSDLLSAVLIKFPDSLSRFADIGRGNANKEASIFYALLSVPPLAINILEDFLKLGASPNKRLWYLPLSIAIRNNREDIYDLLMRYGANISEAISSFRVHWDNWEDAKKYFEFVIRKGADLNVFSDNQDPFLVQFIPSSSDVYATGKKVMLDLFLENGACIKLALAHLYRRDTFDYPLHDRVRIDKFNYLLKIYCEKMQDDGCKIPRIADIDVLQKLGDKIAEDAKRPDNDCQFSFTFKGQQIILFGQRTAAQKRLAEVAFLGVILGVEEHQHLLGFKDDLMQGKLGKIYKKWLELNGLVSIFLPKPSSSY